MVRKLKSRKYSVKQIIEDSELNDANQNNLSQRNNIVNKSSIELATEAYMSMVERFKTNDFNTNYDDDIINDGNLGMKMYNSSYHGLKGIKDSFLYSIDLFTSLVNNDVLENTLGWKPYIKEDLELIVNYKYMQANTVILIKQFHSYHNYIRDLLHECDDISNKRIHYIEFCRDLDIDLSIVNNVDLRHEEYDFILDSKVKEYSTELNSFMYRMYTVKDEVIDILNKIILKEELNYICSGHNDFDGGDVNYGK